MTGLPAYITGVPDLSDRAVTGIGTPLPPHVSIGGNKFTLVDGAGNTKVLGDTMDFLVADIGDVVGKMLFDPAKPWTPNSTEPPLCWSTNGVAPSRDAIEPQARTCAECPNNVRGSAISKMSGKPIKACRDEILTAIVHPQFPTLLFQFKVLPGSFSNWKAYVEECKNVAQGAHVGVVLTRATFEDGVNGVLKFKAVSYPDQATFEIKTKALGAKSTDALVGRLDRPRELAAPVGERLATALADPRALAQQQTDGFGTNQQAAAPATQAQSEPQKRHRRTKAEIEADNAKASQASPQGQQMAPFRPEAPPATQPAGNGAAFGIASNPPGPSAEIAASLEQAFGKPAGGGFGS